MMWQALTSIREIASRVSNGSFIVLTEVENLNSRGLKVI